MQQDGAINAFATRFLRTHIVVLFSDLLEACRDNDAARDMIIGHELGHVRAGHLFGHWLLLPAMFIPFVGAALSRAREFTCDRYGLAAAGDEEGALLGLTILAAGGRYAPRVNRLALARQRQQMASGWMIVGEWLATHPPLSKRLIALAPQLAPPPVSVRLRWARPVFAAVAVFLIGGISMGTWLPSLRGQGAGAVPKVESATGAAQAKKDLERLRTLIEADSREGAPASLGCLGALRALVRGAPQGRRAHRSVHRLLVQLRPAGGRISPLEHRSRWREPDSGHRHRLARRPAAAALEAGPSRTAPAAPAAGARTDAGLN